MTRNIEYGLVEMSVPRLEELYHRRMERDFPPAELPPCARMKAMFESGQMQGWILADAGIERGYAVTLRLPGMYSAVLFLLGAYEEYRGAGYGGMILALLAERYSAAGSILCEVERPLPGDGAAVLSTKIQRIAFYERNGLVAYPGVDYIVYGVPMQLMALPISGSVHETYSHMYEDMSIVNRTCLQQRFASKFKMRMPGENGTPPIPPEAMAQLDAIVCAFAAVLGDDLFGAYLHGSLAMGCFNPRSSDVDVLAVCKCPMNNAQRRSLTALLLEVMDNPYPIELSILNYADIHPWHHPAPYEYHISDSYDAELRAKLDSGAPDSEFDTSGAGDIDLSAHISVTRARGICLYGLPIDEAFEPVPIADYLDSVLADFDWLKARVAENPAYAVLNICRVIRLLSGDYSVCSKREGAEWALTRADIPCKALIARALESYSSGAGRLDDAAGLSELITYADVARQNFNPAISATD